MIMALSLPTAQVLPPLPASEERERTES